MANRLPISYLFIDKSYSSLSLLINAMGLHWEEGKNDLFTGKLYSYFQQFDQSIARKCKIAEQEKINNQEFSDYIYLKWLSKMPGIQALYWRGRNYGIGFELGKNLRKNETDFNKAINRLLFDELFSVFAANIGLTQENIEKIRCIENSCTRDGSLFHNDKSHLVLASVLLDEQSYKYDCLDFDSIEKLADYLRHFLNKSQNEFHSKIKKLYCDNDNLDPLFEGWLINLGKIHELNLWKNNYQKGAGCPEPEPPLDPIIVPPSHPELQLFAQDVFEFERLFEELINDHNDLIGFPQQFVGAMNDYFPFFKLQNNLMITLYRMDIATSIAETNCIDEFFINRFIRRMVNDLGMKEDYARWAVTVWCVYYGEKFLKKNCSITVFRVI